MHHTTRTTNLTTTTNPTATDRPIGRKQRTGRRLLLVAAGAAIALTGCGDDGDSAVVDGVLQVEMTDFTFGDLPAEVPAGTRIEVTNSSTSELHEYVTYRLPDGDDRPVDEIIADAEALLTGGPPVAVLLAPPGSDEQIPAVGDGTLAEPGRYVVLCAIPTGADPADYLAAAATSEGPPQVAGGPPHFVHGMFAELTVTG